MALEQQIVEWAATRPAWQRRILRRLAAGESLGPEDHAQIVEAALSAEHAEESFTLADLPQTTPTDPAVALVSVSELQHVNALESGEPLTFEASGLTIVYGDNGSGKSGYARVLNRVARARKRADVLTDVFRDSAIAKPTARVVVRIGAEEKRIAWPQEATPDLQRLLFYDADCGSSYVSAESDFPYKPAALLVIEGLIDACVAVRSLLDERLTANERSRLQLPSLEPSLRDTPVGQFITRFTSHSRFEDIDALLEGKDISDETIQRLKDEETRLSNADPRAERQRLVRLASKIDAVKNHLSQLGVALSDVARADADRNLRRIDALRADADRLATAFRSEPLAGIGSDSWLALWEAARAYSTQHAYPSRSFPAADEGDHCVFCQQNLLEDGGTRLRRLAAFVADDTQEKLSAAVAAWQTRIQGLRLLHILPDTVESNLQDLEVSHGDLVLKTRTTLTRAQSALDEFLRAVENHGDIPQSGFPTAEIVKPWTEAGAAVRADAIALEDGSLSERISALAKERMELELLKEVAGKRDAIAGEIRRRQEWGRLDAAKSAAATTGLSKKLSELSEEGVTEVVRNAFVRESERLMLQHVTMTKTRAEKGAMLHQPQLVGARQDAALPRVFSEGERTALGLAAFFTESGLDLSRSAIVLDDPVSSLDHVRRAKVASRLVEFARDRQVIVLTHDVAFVADLSKAAVEQGVQIGERSVVRSRGGEKKPGTCTRTHPWKAKDVRARLHELKTELGRLRRESEGWDEQTYEDQVAGWAGKLSETWERIFSQEIVGPVLAVGGTEVRPLQVRLLAAFTEQDDREFQGSYARVSQWAKRHDKSPLVNYVPPALDELVAEIASVVIPTTMLAEEWNGMGSEMAFPWTWANVRRDGDGVAGVRESGRGV